MSAAEATAEVVETVVAEAEEAVAVVVNNPVVLTAVAVVGTTAGAVGGYFLAKRMLETKFEQRLDEEIDKTRAFYHAQQVKQEKSPVELAAARQMPVELGYSAEVPVQSQSDLQMQQESMAIPTGHLEDIEGRVVTDAVEEAAEEIVETVKEEVHSIFDREIPEWDQQAENAARNRSTGPYIISKQEYMENDPEFEQVSLTYFEGDDTLADDRDMPITETDDLIGEDALTRFGYGSGDRNVVYVRNSVREMDFEIVRSDGDYASTVAGFLQHSSYEPRSRRRRGFDE